jgi:hypothetical protein
MKIYLGIINDYIERISRFLMFALLIIFGYHWTHKK